jgi:hypothetical protein
MWCSLPLLQEHNPSLHRVYPFHLCVCMSVSVCTGMCLYVCVCLSCCLSPKDQRPMSVLCCTHCTEWEQTSVLFLVPEGTKAISDVTCGHPKMAETPPDSSLCRIRITAVPAPILGVCMCVCMCVRVCVCAWVCVHVRICECSTPVLALC